MAPKIKKVRKLSPKEQYQNEVYLANYKEMVKKLRVLSKVAVRQFLGTRRADDDPRLEYMTDLEAFKNLANVHLEVLMELTIKKLGITRKDSLKVHGDQLAAQLKTMEQDLCVTGWDEKGSPIFDLAAYRERTKLWPA